MKNRRNSKFRLLFVFVYKIIQKVIRQLYCLYYPFIVKRVHKIHVLSIDQTINSLINTNRSLSRFGDGEIDWALGNKNYGSFEKSSSSLQRELLQVLKSNNNYLEIGLPDAMRGLKQFVPPSASFWKGTIARYWNRISLYLYSDRTYYNTAFSRFYIDYRNKRRAKYLFLQIKKIWNYKKILIIEGKYSRLGLDNNLFSNVKCIKRIECPPVNAFEHYNNILKVSKRFLCNHNDFLTLLSLGPTATILAYDLSNLGYRAIDIGHIDLEYDWFLRGANKKINIPTKYVNSYKVKNGMQVTKVHNKKYNSEIYCYVK